MIDVYWDTHLTGSTRDACTTDASRLTGQQPSHRKPQSDSDVKACANVRPISWPFLGSRTYSNAGFVAGVCLLTAVGAAGAAPAPPGQVCLESPTITTCTEEEEAASTAQPSTGSGNHPSSVKRNHFHPGHYMMVGHNAKTSTYQRIEGEPYIVGIKHLYRWRDLEPAKGVYDFSQIEQDLSYISAMGKYLFLQIRYTQYNGNRSPNVPDYVTKDARYGCGGKSPDGRRYHGTYYRSQSTNGGWLPCIWDSDLQERFVALYIALGRRFNSEPYIEGVALDETAIATKSARGLPGYSTGSVERGFKTILSATKNAFPSKSVMQLVNYTVFDVNDFGTWLQQNGIGIGGPDVSAKPDRLRAQAYAQYRRLHNNVPTGPNVEWSNYTENDSVKQIYEAALEFTNPWYIFWLVREPYFSDDVLPLTRRNGHPPAAAGFYR